MLSPTLRRATLGVLLLGLVAALTLVWATRHRIAQRLLLGALARRGVPASAVIESVTDTGLRVRNLRLGPRARPDLTAAHAQIGFGWIGLTPSITAIRANHAVLRLSVAADGRVHLGTLDRLRPPPDGTPARLPDIDLDLRDSRVIAATPWGALTGTFAGAGNPAHSFTGTLTLGPARLLVAGCALPLVNARLRLGAVERIGRIAGPLTLGPLGCRGAHAAGAGADMALTLPDPITRANGRVTLALVAPRVGGFSAAAAQVGFAGGIAPDRIAGKSNLSTQGLNTAGWNAGAARFTGHASYDPRGGGFDLAGPATIDHAALPAPLRARLGAPTSGLASTPLGPLEARARAALAAAASDFGASAMFAARGTLAVPRATLSRLAARAQTGARLDLGRSSIALTPGHLTVLRSGTLALGGGGLPTLTLALDGQAGEAHDLTLAEYRANSASVAATRLALTLTPGAVALAGPLLLDGPLGPGHVEGLSIPDADLSIGLGPTLTLTPARCLALGARRLVEPRYTLNDAATTLCPDGPMLAVAADGRLSGRATAPALTARGVFAGTPFTLATGRIALAVAGSDVAPVVDVVASPVRAVARLASGSRPLDLARLTATARETARGWTFAGRIEGGALPGLPVRVDGIAGDWALDAADALTLTHASAAVVDLAPRPRFAPLVAENLRVVYADGRAALSGALGLAAGPGLKAIGGMGTADRLATFAARYTVADSTGTLDADATLPFSPALQPYQLSERLRGVVENVAGTVTATAHLTYARGAIAGSTSLALDHLSFATAALGPVRDVTGTLTLPHLPELASAPAHFAIGAVNPGVLVERGEATLQLLSPTRLRIDALGFPFAGGRMALVPTTLDTTLPERRFTLLATGLDLAQFLQRLDFKNFDATGIFDGKLPLVLSNKGSRLVGGYLAARAPGGRLRYVGAFDANLPAPARLAFGALKSMRYETLTIGVNGDLDAELVTDIAFTGANEAPIQAGKRARLGPGVPFRFGVTVRAPFRALLGTASSLEDITPYLRGATPFTPPSPPPAH